MIVMNRPRGWREYKEGSAVWLLRVRFRRDRRRPRSGFEGLGVLVLSIEVDYEADMTV